MGMSPATTGPTGNFLSRVRSISDREITQAVANAPKRLERMAVVGVTEHFHESLELVADLLGVAPPDALPAVNIGPKKVGVAVGGYRATMSPSVIEQVEALTTYDRELYACALDLFNQQYARYKAAPAPDIADPRRAATG